MALDDEINKPSIKINVVVKIGTQVFARYRPDSGLPIDDKWLIVNTVNFAKAILDLRDIKTSIPTDSFTLLDKDYVATDFLLAPANRYLDTEVSIWVGVSDANFDFSNYILTSRANIKEISRIVNGYNISVRRNVELTSKPIWYVYNNLRKDMSEFDTIIPLESSDFFPDAGIVRINEEIITYTANDKPTGVLSGLTRGQYSSKNDSTEVTVNGAAGNSLDGKYFLINTPTQGYAVWYFSNSGSAPAGYPFNIMVTIPSNASADEVASRTMNAVNAGVAFTATSGNDKVIITSVAAGPTTAAQDFNTGFKFRSINLSIQNHRVGEDVYSIRLLQANPITAMLQLMISNGGGGVYDVLPYGLGIAPTQIDVAGIEYIRDTYYPTDAYRFFIYQVSSGQEFFEKNICLPTNTRLTNDNGLITLVYIDQSTIYDHVADENTIMGIPDWSVSVDKVVNSIAINYDYDVGLDSFGKVAVFENAQSITDYTKKEKIYNFQGIYTELDGNRIVTELGSKLLIRLKDPRTKITANTFFTNMDFKLGSTVKLTHKYVPGDKTMGIDADMTVLEKSIDFNKGTVSLGLYYTTISASGVKRFGVIAPNQPITAVTSQRTFTVADGSWYAVGYKISIDNEIQTIRIITINTITVDVAFLTPLTIGKKVNIVEYARATAAQKNRYAFVSPPNGANFADGGLPYQVVLDIFIDFSAQRRNLKWHL